MAELISYDGDLKNDIIRRYRHRAFGIIGSSILGVGLSFGLMLHSATYKNKQTEDVNRYQQEHPHAVELTKQYDAMRTTLTSLKNERPDLSLSLERRFPYLPSHIHDDFRKALPQYFTYQERVASLDAALVAVEQDIHAINSNPEFQSYQNFLLKKSEENIPIELLVFLGLLGLMLSTACGATLFNLNSERKQDALQSLEQKTTAR